MKRLIISICFSAFICCCYRSAGSSTNRWKTYTLWTNQVLSATLKYLPVASVADEDYMFVEFDNHTGGMLDVSQAWISLPATTIDKRTQKTAFTGDVATGVIYNGKLLPGKTTAFGNGVFLAGLDEFQPTPEQGFHIEFSVKADARLTDGTVFSTSNNNTSLSFDFRRPNAMKVESMKARFKELLANPNNQFASGYYLNALSKVPEVAAVATVGELLSAFQAHSTVDGKGAISRIIGTRFPNDPKVVAYFLEGLSHGDNDALFLVPDEVLTNRAFVEPLVKRYETKGDDLRQLQQLRSEWITNHDLVARLSVALLQRHPVLNHPVASLSGTNLCNWCSAVGDAGIIGNTNFLKWLVPALEDARTMPDCISKWDSRPRLRWQPRICDCALGAILMIVDGDSWAAFKRAGIKSWSTKEEDYAAHDRVIADLKKRLSSRPGKHPK